MVIGLGGAVVPAAVVVPVAIGAQRVSRGEDRAADHERDGRGGDDGDDATETALGFESLPT